MTPEEIRAKATEIAETGKQVDASMGESAVSLGNAVLLSSTLLMIGAELCERLDAMNEHLGEVVRELGALPPVVR